MFHALKIYTVHTRPEVDITRAAPKFVREGFSPAAFVFTGLWALYHGMWKYAALILIANAAIAYAGQSLNFSEASLAVLQIGFNAVIGFHANDALRAHLKKRGYIMADIVSGTSLPKAEKRYFERALAQLAAQPA